MATLEKIRSKSVLLIVVIGVALLAFIIGDAISNSRNLFGDQTTVAKIGDTKIDYNDYVRKREELNSQLEAARRQNPAQYANYDTQLMPQMALEQLIAEALIDQAAENAGIRTSASQLRFYMLEQPINPHVGELIQQLNAAGYGVTTPAQAWEVVFNPAQNGATDAEMAPFQKYWVGLESETAQLIKRNTYQRLLSGTVKANKLDKEAMYNDYISTMNVALAYKNYENFNDDKYAPTDSELRAEYENIKGRYKVDELTKDIAFISVSIAPSDVDKKSASELASQTAAALRKGDANLSKDLRKEGVVVTRRQVREKDLKNGAVKDFVTTAPKDSVKIVTENIKGFTVVKAGNKKVEIDSLQLNIVQVLGAGLVNKTMESLNAGVVIDSIASDSVMIQKEQWIALFNANGATGALEATQVDSLLNANGKYISLVTTPQGSVLAKVTGKSSPKTIYEFDEVNYELKPSTQTVNDARTKLEDFLAANTTTKEFMENAAKAGYNVRQLSVNPSTPGVPRMGGSNSYYPDSRQVVRWVLMDAKPGNVSHVYESKDAMAPALYATAVIAEYDDYIPITNNEVNKEVSNRVKKSKVGDELMTKYTPSASSMATVSQAMSVETQNDSTFRFGNNAKVRDASVIGKIAGSKPGKVVLVKGDNGIYAYQIISEAKEEFPYTDAQYEQQYIRMVQPDLGEMLKGSKNVKNNIYKFEAGD